MLVGKTTLEVDSGYLHHHAHVSLAVLPHLTDVPGVLESLGLSAQFCHHSEGYLSNVIIRIVVVDIDHKSSSGISIEAGGNCIKIGLPGKLILSKRSFRLI